MQLSKTIASVLSLIAPALIVLGSAGTADAQPIALPGGPQAGNWSFGVSFPVDLTLAPDDTPFGFGLGLGVGNRLSERLYLGATVDFERLLSASTNLDVPDFRVRAGGEVRYIIDQDVNVAAVRHMGLFSIPTTKWIGGRAGVEGLSPGSAITSTGSYAELTFGADYWSDSTQYGLFLSAGFTREPGSIYGTPAPDPFTHFPVFGHPGAAAPPASPPMTANSASTVTAAYLAFGWRLGFG